jgi:hypothetical protein
MALENTVIDKLTAAFGDNVFTPRKKDIFSFEIPAEKITVDCSL